MYGDSESTTHLDAFVDEQLMKELGKAPTLEDLKRTELRVNHQTKEMEVIYQGRNITSNGDK